MTGFPGPGAPLTLHRRLGTFSVALFGLAYICPTVVISTFGVLVQTTGGGVAFAYFIATAAILLTAFSYARMSARYPQAGSAYAYVTQTTNPSVGFLAGWVLALDYFFMPMVVCLFTAKAIEVVLPAISYRIWVIVIAAATTCINLLGIKLANRVNLAIMVAQFAVIAALVVMCLAFLGASATPSSTVFPTFLGAHANLQATMGGAAIAAYSFLGFDAVTTLSEEAKAPTRSIPIATVFAAAASGLIYIVTSYLMGRVHPSLEFKDVDNAGYEVLQLVTGRGFIVVFVIIMAAFLASVMCAQVGSSRLLYAMGRDEALPGVFAHINRRFRCPDFNIVLTGIVMLIGLLIDVETATSCVNFGAFTAFTAVNLCVVFDHASGRRELPGRAFKLIQAIAGAVTSAWLIGSLQRNAIVVRSIWLVAGVGYLLVRTRGLRVPLRGVVTVDPQIG